MLEGWNTLITQVSLGESSNILVDSGYKGKTFTFWCQWTEQMGENVLITYILMPEVWLKRESH